MKFGRYNLSPVLFGMFRLDGGAMFGSVPKNLWGKTIPVDEENCIPLACRSLLLKDSDRVVLIDVGMGEKWDDKSRKIYKIENNPETQWGFDRNSVTDLVLTHLHFDHAGGVSRFGVNNALELSFPNATVYLQQSNYAHAKNPTLKDRASYLKENVEILGSAQLKLVDGTIEVLPDIFVHRVDGHTPGQQWVEIKNGKESIFFATDLVPTSRHLPLPFHMGYDICAETILNEKEAFLARAVSENAIVFFEHDPDTPAARIHKTRRGIIQ